MLYIRSLAFNIAFYVSLIIQMIFWSPLYFLSPRHKAWFVPKFWSRNTRACCRALDWAALAPLIVDARNALSREEVEAAGARYLGVGRPVTG